MWPQFQKDYWQDLDALQEPTTVGRRLDVGGFILADSFDTFLKNISTTYLESFWHRLSHILNKHQLNIPDLSWGFFHPGETTVKDKTAITPLDYMGLSSPQLIDFDTDSRYQTIAKDLIANFPTSRFVSTWRSLKWNILPDNFPLALRLLESMCLDEPTNWTPEYVTKTGERETIWYGLAVALQNKDDAGIIQLLQEAEATYSAIGYRILTKGFSEHRPK